MKTIKVLLIFLPMLFLSCEKDKYDFGDCEGNDCLQASGYVYNRLSSSPLKSAQVVIKFQMNCGWCGTGCPNTVYDIGTVKTNSNGYFQTNFSSEQFNHMTGTYIIDISYEDFVEEKIRIANDSLSEIIIESELSPPAWLNLSFDFNVVENLEDFVMSMHTDSSSGYLIHHYTSGIDGMFSDTTLTYKVPAERMIFYGYRIDFDGDSKYVEKSVIIEKYKTKDINIVE